jgi:O-antigen/teichoic acid export membrane protein
MAGLAHRTVILTLTRLANLGLMIISPVILVRFLSVGEFGRYREFLLYATLLQVFASFSVFDCLLYFIPAHPQSKWRVVREANILTALISVSVVVAAVILNAIMGGVLLGRYFVPVIAYVLLYINLDFWEAYWLATSRLIPVFLYTAGRLSARMLVVVGVAVATANVTAIIWSLIALEGIRFAGSAVAWYRLDRSRHEPTVPHLARTQLRFCLPTGLAVLMVAARGNLGNVAVDKLLGAAALAQLTIGTYGEPIIGSLRNSISTLLLPEMVRRSASGTEDRLLLWQRATVINCILLFPAAVLLVLFAEPLILRVFGEHYRPAIPVLQIYSLVIIRACFDFSPPLRAINKTGPMVTSNLAAAGVNGICLILLLPTMGLIGAIVSMVVANTVEGFLLGWSTTRLYEVGIRQILPWGQIARVALCALTVGAVAFALAWSRISGFGGVALASVAYIAAFAVLSHFAGVSEMTSLLHRIKDRMVTARARDR